MEALHPEKIISHYTFQKEIGIEIFYYLVQPDKDITFSIERGDMGLLSGHCFLDG
jgi:hypothetical protein